MIILVDAYNVLKRNSSVDISAGQRERFIATLSSYARKKGHEIVMVFDGGSSNWPEVIHKNRLRIVYSGYKSSADDYIVDFMQKHAGKQVLLVSSDRKLCGAADQADIASIDSETFLRLVHQALATLAHRATVETRLVKVGDQDNDQLDALMREAADDVQVKPEDLYEKQGHDYGEQSAKNERKLLQILKKL